VIFFGESPGIWEIELEAVEIVGVCKILRHQCWFDPDLNSLAGSINKGISRYFRLVRILLFIVVSIVYRFSNYLDPADHVHRCDLLTQTLCVIPVRFYIDWISSYKTNCRHRNPRMGFPAGWQCRIDPQGRQESSMYR